MKTEAQAAGEPRAPGTAAGSAPDELTRMSRELMEDEGSDWLPDDEPEAVEPGATAAPELDPVAEPAATKVGTEDGGQRTEDGELPEEGVEPKAAVKFSAEQQRVFDRRVGELVAQRNAAREELEAERAALRDLQAKLNEQPAAAAPTGGDELLAAPDAAAVEKHESYLRDVESFCLKNWDGYTAGEGDEAVSYTAQEVRERYAWARQRLEKDVPKALRLVEKRKAAETEARAAYPELAQEGSALRAAYEALLRQAPGLRLLADGPMLAADALAGRAARLTKRKAGAAAAPRAPALAPQPAGGTATAPAARATKKGAFEKYAEAGFDDEDGLEQAFAD